MSTSSSSQSLSSSETLCGVGDRWVKLLLQVDNDYLVNDVNGFRIRVEVIEYCNIEPEIFRYYRDTASGAIVDSFNGVCDWSDMENWPTTAPREVDCPQPLRKDYFDVVVDAAAIAADTWDKVKEEVNALVEAMNAGDDLVDGTEIQLDGT